MSRQAAPRQDGVAPRWSPPPLLYASAAVHLGAAAAALARPRVWPWALGAVALNHVALAAAGLWPRSQLLGPNWIRLPAHNGVAAGVSIWLGGISLGGLIALDYAASYPGELDGLCLLAPYLGNRILTTEIAQAPGLAAWQPGELAETDEERRIWRYIKARHAGSRPLYLGFGNADRFSAAHELLAATLPAESVDVIAGAHDWPTWSRLWENFLDSHFT